MDLSNIIETCDYESFTKGLEAISKVDVLADGKVAIYYSITNEYMEAYGLIYKKRVLVVNPEGTCFIEVFSDFANTQTKEEI